MPWEDRSIIASAPIFPADITFPIVLLVTGHAQVYIDLGAQHRTDTIRIDISMKSVGANDNLSLGRKFTNFFCLVFLFCNRYHLRGKDAASCRIHLYCIVSHHLFSFLADIDFKHSKFRSKEITGHIGCRTYIHKAPRQHESIFCY